MSKIINKKKAMLLNLVKSPILAFKQALDFYGFIIESGTKV